LIRLATRPWALSTMTDRTYELARLIKALDRKAFLENRELTAAEQKQRDEWRDEQERLFFTTQE